jgi:hypothetical protein
MIKKKAFHQPRGGRSGKGHALAWFYIPLSCRLAKGLPLLCFLIVFSLVEAEGFQRPVFSYGCPGHHFSFTLKLLGIHR